MTRPSVSVVMPFAGDEAAARAAVATLLALSIAPGDELILADNSGAAPAAHGVQLVRASAERSPAHARNAGAQHAGGEWILFLDADCVPATTLLDDYFASPVGRDVGALAGEVVPSPGASTLAARYASERSFLGQAAHLSHPYLPRAVAANLMVRRTAFEQVGGFLEGVRAAEDTDFSWRLQHAGWRLELRSGARVEHTYRATLRELRRQWRGYAAGRAWLGRRYDGFTPEPALRRGLRRGLNRGLGGAVRSPPPNPPPRAGRLDRGRYLALDVLLGAEELGGFALSNRPAGRSAAIGSARVVLVADRFPSRGDPLAEFAHTLEGAQIEAAARPDTVELGLARSMNIAYREDDGAGVRAASMVRLAIRHPLRCLLDVRRRAGRAHGDPPEVRLAVLAPAARRISRHPAARLHVLGGEPAREIAMRLAALTGRQLDGEQQ
ncbi:MAG: glycosyltransferase family 2 protein [Solirubrobacteraceae bacterium]